MPRGSPGQRREQILQTFATMLESRPGSRITTAALAKEVGVSEAALYRHFPSKARMFEGLIEFIEETIFSRTPRVMAETEDPRARCRGVLLLLLQVFRRTRSTFLGEKFCFKKSFFTSSVAGSGAESFGF